MPISAAVVLGCVAIFVDKVIVSRAFGAAVYAAYANGALELPFITILTGSITTVLFPELVVLVKDGHAAELLALWQRAIQRCNVVLIPFLGWLLYLAPETVVVLYGIRYADSATVFRLYLCTIPIRVVMYGPLAMSFGANWMFTASQGLAGGVALLLGGGLVWLFHMPALAAVGTVTGIYAGFVFAASRLSPRMGIRARQFLPLRHWLSTLGASAASGLVAYLVTWPLGSKFQQALQAGQKTAVTWGIVRLGASMAVFAILYLWLTTKLGLADWRMIIRSLLMRKAAGTPTGTATLAETVPLEPQRPI